MAEGIIVLSLNKTCCILQSNAYLLSPLHNKFQASVAPEIGKRILEIKTSKWAHTNEQYYLKKWKGENRKAKTVKRKREKNKSESGNLDGNNGKEKTKTKMTKHPSLPVCCSHAGPAAEAKHVIRLVPGLLQLQRANMVCNYASII